MPAPVFRPHDPALELSPLEPPSFSKQLRYVSYPYETSLDSIVELARALSEKYTPITIGLQGRDQATRGSFAKKIGDRLGVSGSIPQLESECALDEVSATAILGSTCLKPIYIFNISNVGGAPAEIAKHFSILIELLEY